MNEIEEFIKRRFDVDCHWTEGNCYYFAMILCWRFPHLKKVYFPIEGHWAVEDGEAYYDFNGRTKQTLWDVCYPEDWLKRMTLIYTIALQRIVQNERKPYT